MTPQPAKSTDVRPVPRDCGPWSGLIMYGLFIPPLAWAIELYLNFGLASHACFPDGAPRASFLPGWEGIWIVLVAVSLICAAICAIGLISSGYSWRSLSRERPPAEAIGEVLHPSEGRLRAFAVSGLIVSGLFTVAILFDSLYLWALSTCSQV
jgi:hypothetical protein